MSTEIGIHITAKDDASQRIAAASNNITQNMQKVEQSASKASVATQKASNSTKDAVVGFSGLAVSAFGVYTTFDRIEKSGVAVDRANLMVKRSTETLEAAPKNVE